MKKYRFKLLAGHHAFNEGTNESPKIIRFRQGDVFETDQPLDEIYNTPAGNKFQRIQENIEDTEELLLEEERKLAERKAKLLAKKAPEPAVRRFEDDPEKMTVVQLQELADENGIDLGKARTKEQILEVIKASVASA